MALRVPGAVSGDGTHLWRFASSAAARRTAKDCGNPAEPNRTSKTALSCACPERVPQPLSLNSVVVVFIYIPREDA